MKLIIDISEEDYAETMYRKQHTPRDMDWADKIIANGTPLDDVKAEIREQQKEYQEWGWAYDDALEILDNIGKTESEDMGGKS